MCVVECQNCGALQTNVPAGTIVKMCFDCVREIVAPAYSQAPKKTGFPKGWKFMKVFVYSDGTVYHKGVEQPTLKGTLDPTVIEPKIKKSKAQKAQEKQQALAELQKLKIALKKETRKTYAKKLESQIKRLQRQL
ncbi:hypothetical protein UFOVP450_137 [uncultured Caudovirales phage]|uniref:Uncharacterized protein n=1 Tax=uncultured Caudovirales phage TaxID=2100421 RepID=A0A6J5MEC3_9CAUD|nr:hypothetical protein UFOVP450_137 [uncultured Caudovirales phage]